MTIHVFLLTLGQDERGRDPSGRAGTGPGGPDEGAAAGVAARGRAAAVAGPGHVALGRAVDSATQDASRRGLRHLPRQVMRGAVRCGESRGESWTC